MIKLGLVLKTLCLAVALCYLPAGSGNVRVIGNGGGNSEMKVLSQFSTLKLMLKALATNPKIFLSDDCERELSVQTLSLRLKHLANSLDWTLGFSNVGPAYKIDKSQKQIIINLSQLRGEDGGTMPLLVEAYIKSTGTYASGEQVFLQELIHENLFTGDEWTIQVSQLSQVKLIAFKNNFKQYLIFQNSNQFLDLSPLIASDQACGLKDFRLLQVLGLSRRKNEFLGHIHWSCGGGESQARFLASISNEGVKFQVFGRSR